MAHQRLDSALVSRGFFQTREKARAAVLAGEVSVASVKVSKPGQRVDDSVPIQVAAAKKYVSRGGLKLEGALDAFRIDVSGVRAIDIGASTGGFTDCLLKRGARGVTAVDVGYGQLAWSLREDDRVTVFERTNIRHARPDLLGAPFDLAVVDVSFISLNVVAGRVIELLAEEGILLALVKPQFEVGKGRVGKGGVVCDPALHREVLQRVSHRVREAGAAVMGACVSPIAGPKGNIEFWLWAQKGSDPSGVTIDVEAIVAEAHEKLGA